MADTVEAETMLPCPFCGGIPTMEPWHGGGPDKVLIHCENDGCDANPSVSGERPSEATRRWNVRKYVSRAGR